MVDPLPLIPFNCRKMATIRLIILSCSVLTRSKNINKQLSNNLVHMKVRMSASRLDIRTTLIRHLSRKKCLKLPQMSY
jgi:hypothetical protein